MKDGLLSCSRICRATKINCNKVDCKFFIDYSDDYNCCLISIYENGFMTLRQIGERLKISFARVKQIETKALKKMKKSKLIS
jgi:hypothetical protein